MKSAAHVSLRLAASTALVAWILVVSTSWTVASDSEPSTAGFSHFRSGMAPLMNSHRWILQGKKLANGACRFETVDGEMEIPLSGWEERTIALDPGGCRKLMEAGTPTDLTSASPKGTESSASVAAPSPASAPSAPGAAVLTTTTAYIRIFWMDPASIKVNQDVTQVHWSSNGSTVSGARS